MYSLATTQSTILQSTRNRNTKKLVHSFFFSLVCMSMVFFCLCVTSEKLSQANKSSQSSDVSMSSITLKVMQKASSPGEKRDTESRARHVYLLQVQYWFTWKANSFRDKIANINKQNVLRWKSNMILRHTRKKNPVSLSSFVYRNTHAEKSAWVAL